MNDAPLTMDDVNRTRKILSRIPLRHRVRPFLINLWNWRTAWACRYMRKQLQKDPSFWQTYHANIVCVISDQLQNEGIRVSKFQPQPHDSNQVANHCADRLMAHLFDAPPTPERLHRYQ